MFKGSRLTQDKWDRTSLLSPKQQLGKSSIPLVAMSGIAVRKIARHLEPAPKGRSILKV